MSFFIIIMQAKRYEACAFIHSLSATAFLWEWTGLLRNPSELGGNVRRKTSCTYLYYCLCVHILFKTLTSHIKSYLWHGFAIQECWEAKSLTRSGGTQEQDVALLIRATDSSVDVCWLMYKE